MKGRVLYLAVMSLPVIGFVGSIALLIWGLALPALEARNVRSWTATPCEVIRSELRSSGRGKSEQSSFEVSYKYSYNGTHYTGDRPKIGKSWNILITLGQSHLRARELAARYPVGTRATCHVNPALPSESVLDPTFQLSPLHAGPVLVVVFVGYGLFRFLRGSGFFMRRPKLLEPPDISERPRL